MRLIVWFDDIRDHAAAVHKRYGIEKDENIECTHKLHRAAVHPITTINFVDISVRCVKAANTKNFMGVVKQNQMIAKHSLEMRAYASVRT